MILVIPIFIPHAGCPHDCCFCNQKVISGKKSQPTKGSIVSTIESYRAVSPRFDEVQLAFYGGSFTAIPAEEQVRYLEIVQDYLKVNDKEKGFIDTLRMSTRPDAVDTDTIARLKKYHVRIVELGSQSMDGEVLKKCERGHTAEATIKASKLLKENGFVLGLQTMTGLPGATIESDLETADKIIEQKPDFVRIYPTIVVENTKLARDYNEGKYKPRTLEETVELCAKLCEKYEANNITVVRIGLQSTDSISNQKDTSEIVAGPYHEAFGGLVKSFRLLKQIEKILDDNNICSANNLYQLVIKASKDTIPQVVGQNKSNINELQAKYGFKFVKVKPVQNTDKDAPKITTEKVVMFRSKEHPDGIFGTKVTINLQ